MNINQQHFDAGDYTIFSFMLLLPLLIGIYYAFFSKQKMTNVSEYLIGNGNMGVFPVAMSLTASAISASSMIAPVSEIYFYGIQYMTTEIAKIIASFFGANVYIPVIHNLKLASMYEYFGMRFDNKVRLLGTVLFVLQMLLFAAIVIHLPALLFEHVMGIRYEIFVPVLCAVCIFYTSFGGIFAVIWTDTFQMLVMMVGMFVFAIVGMYNVGDLKRLWEINKQGGRLNFFVMNPDPLIRQSFWTNTIGGFFNILAVVTASQLMVQRSASLSSLKKVNIAVLIYILLGLVIKLSTVCIGLAIYATFHDCDPLTSRKISQPDQLIAFYMMHLKDQIPILPAMVISAAFCASLSTISSCLNSVAGIILIDIIQPFCKRPISDARGAILMKIMVVVAGLVAIGLSFSMEQSSGIIQSNLSLAAILSGTTLGVFTLGILLPWANATGALIGKISGGALVAWISLGSQMAIRNKQIVNVKLPLSIENCDNVTISKYYDYLNRTMANVAKSNPGEPFPLYKISFLYLALIGMLTAVIVGMIVSYFTGFNNPNDMDPKLFSPVIHGYLKRKRDKEEGREMIDRKI